MDTDIGVISIKLFIENHIQMYILQDQIIGPLFINGNLTGNSYFWMQKEVIDPLIAQAFETEEELQENTLIFQHYYLDDR